MSNPNEMSHRRGQIDDRRIALERRIEDGYGRIELALAKGQDVVQWEAFWIDLLHQYEALCDERLAQAA